MGALNLAKNLVPPVIRGAVYAEQAAMPVMHGHRPTDIPTIPVEVERSNEGTGVNNRTVDVGHARTARGFNIKIICPVAVSTGDFSSAIQTHTLEQTTDTFEFSPPPDGLTYLFSFYSTINFQLDALTGLYRPYADYYFCNPGGTAQGQPAKIELQRKAQRRFYSCIWTDASVPAGYVVNINAIFKNLGDGR